MRLLTPWACFTPWGHRQVQLLRARLKARPLADNEWCDSPARMTCSGIPVRYTRLFGFVAFLETHKP